MKRSKHFAMVLVGCICAQLIGIGGALAAADEKGTYICDLPGEQIITSPQQVDGYVTRVSGIVDIKEDGFAVYYSTQDYEYETKENAIWFSEREDYPLKKFLEDNPEIKQGEILGSLSGLFGVINEQKENGYAATATYLNLDELSYDNAYKRAKKEHLKPGQRYDRQEEKKDAIEVSYYRLQGNPEQYDGKKVKVEVVFQSSEDAVVSANRETLKFRGIWQEDYVNDEFIEEDYMEAWAKLSEEYKQYSETGSKMIWGIGIASKKMHVDITCMYYMYYDVRKDYVQFIGYGEISPSYALKRLEVHEKDRGKLIQLLEKFEKEIKQ